MKDKTMTMTRVVTVRRTDPTVKGAWEYAEIKGSPDVVQTLLDFFDLSVWEIYLDRSID